MSNVAVNTCTKFSFIYLHIVTVRLRTADVVSLVFKVFLFLVDLCNIIMLFVHFYDYLRYLCVSVELLAICSHLWHLLYMGQ